MKLLESSLRIDSPTGVGAAAPTRHRFKLFVDMAAFLEDAFTRIERARREVFVENYIVKHDLLGEALLERLEDAAARGVDVRLLYDGSGSHKLPHARVVGLRGMGVRARRYGLVPALGILRPGFRDHARLLLVDDTAYTGGHAWARPWLPRDRGGEGWADVNCRVAGPLCSTWKGLFERRWDEAVGRWPASLDTENAFPDARLISDAPGLPHQIANAYIAAAAAAKRRIWIGNAYFFPNPRLLKALYAARSRGVDVKLILPGASDLMLVGRAARSRYEAWMARGLDIYEFEQTMMHAKYAIVDDDWVTVGSFNALGAAMEYAVETNLVLRSPRVVRRAADHFRAQLAASQRVTLARVRARRLSVKALDLLASGALRFFNWALHRLTRFWRWTTECLIERLRPRPGGAAATAPPSRPAPRR